MAATSPVTATTTSGAVSLGLNTPALETTLNGFCPRLSAANAFSGNQSITGSLTTTGTLSASSSAVTGLSSAAGGFLSNGAVTVAPGALATSAAAVNSPLFELDASAWSSASSAAVAQNYAWQTQVIGNDTAAPTSNLALLFGAGTAAPSATGLSIASNGNIGFVAGQTFPGTGTLTGITTASPLTGSGTTGSVALGLDQSALVTAIAPSIATTIAPALQSTFNGDYAQLGAANTFTSGQIIQGASTIGGSGNTSGPMLTVNNNGNSFSTAITASNTGQYGLGEAVTAGADGVAIKGYGTQTPGAIGVFGSLSDSNGASNSYFLLNNDDGLDAGVWADGPDGQEAALIATSDDLSAGIFFNDSQNSSTIEVLNNYSGGPLGKVVPAFGSVLRAAGPGGMCGINQTGTLSCTGQVKAIVPTKDGTRQVETYTVQSAENWVEDYGSGQLTHGAATVIVEPAFAETVNTGVEFHVFLTAGGDCKGLYVTNKTAGSLEVHELGGGASSIPFDYKIVAKRNGMEDQRLVDVTERMRMENPKARFKPLAQPLPRNRNPRPQPAAGIGKMSPAVNR